MNPWHEILSLCDQLAEHMDRHGAGADPDALRAAMSICYRMRSTSSYINDRVNKLERELDRYFSARKWASHAQGADGVRHEIVHRGLPRIRDEANERIKQEAQREA